MQYESCQFRGFESGCQVTSPGYVLATIQVDKATVENVAVRVIILKLWI